MSRKASIIGRRRANRWIGSAAQSETIDVIELPKLDEQEDAASIAKLAEIAENLHRREITALERSELQAAWIEIVQARKKEAADKPAEVRQVSEKGGRGKTSGMSQVARELGVPRSTLQQSVKIAKLSPEAKAEARKLKLDNNQDALLAAAKAKTPEDQVTAIERRAAPSKSAKPKATPPALRDLKAAWNDNIEPLVRTADDDVGKAFIEWISRGRK